MARMGAWDKFVFSLLLKWRLLTYSLFDGLANTHEGFPAFR